MGRGGKQLVHVDSPGGKANRPFLLGRGGESGLGYLVRSPWGGEEGTILLVNPVLGGKKRGHGGKKISRAWPQRGGKGKNHIFFWSGKARVPSLVLKKKGGGKGEEKDSWQCFLFPRVMGGKAAARMALKEAANFSPR